MLKLKANMRFVYLLVIVIAGCAGVPPSAPLDSSDEHATITLVSNDPQSDLPGFFTSLDGVELKSIPRIIQVKPGKRKVGYECRVVLDGPEITATAYFQARKNYVLRCAGERGTIELE